MNNLESKFLIDKTCLLKQYDKNKILYDLTSKIINFGLLPDSLEFRNFALSGAFYFNKLNKVIGINYIPQVFIDKVLNLKEKNIEAICWDAGFMYMVKNRPLNAELKELNNLSSNEESKIASEKIIKKKITI